MKYHLREFFNALLLTDTEYAEACHVSKVLRQLPICQASDQPTRCIVSGGSYLDRVKALKHYLQVAKVPVVILTCHWDLGRILGVRPTWLCDRYDPLANKKGREASYLLRKTAELIGLRVDGMASVLENTIQAIRSHSEGGFQMNDFLTLSCAELGKRAFFAGDDETAGMQTLEAARQLDDLRIQLSQDVSLEDSESSSLEHLLEQADGYNSPLVLLTSNPAQSAMYIQDLYWTMKRRSRKGKKTNGVLFDLATVSARQLEELYTYGNSSTLFLNEDLPASQDLFRVAASGLTSGIFLRHVAGAEELSRFIGQIKRLQITETISHGRSKSEFGSGPFGIFGNTTRSSSRSEARSMAYEPIVTAHQLASLPDGEGYLWEQGKLTCIKL